MATLVMMIRVVFLCSVWVPFTNQFPSHSKHLPAFGMGLCPKSHCDFGQSQNSKNGTFETRATRHFMAPLLDVSLLPIDNTADTTHNLEFFCARVSLADQVPLAG